MCSDDKNMKHDRHILVFGSAIMLLAVTVLAGGCVVGNKVSNQEPVMLKCKAVMSQNTRSETGFSTVFGLDEEFVLWAFSLPRGNKWDTFKPDAQPFVTRKQFVGNVTDSLWYCSGNIVWPYSKALTLIAYAPFEASGDYDENKGIVFESYNVLEKPYDLLYTEYQKDQLNDNNRLSVQIPFEHALCKVDIKTRTMMSASYEVKVKKIVFAGLKYRGTFNSHPNPVWYADSATTDMVLYESETGWTLPENNEKIVAGTPRYMIPHTLNANIQVTVEISGPVIAPVTKTLTTTAVSVTWAPGKYYTYTLEISPESIKFDEPETKFL